MSYLLAVLDLRANRLGTIEAADLAGLTGLVDLDLSNNLIDNIQGGAFHHQSNLQSLNLTSNRLSLLQPNTFDGPVRLTLKDLYLAHNMLTTVLLPLTSSPLSSYLLLRIRQAGN